MRKPLYLLKFHFYVEANARMQCIVKKLVATYGEWARLQGCVEFVSDCELKQ